MNQKLATIIQSGLCKTNTKSRPLPSLFYFPGLSSKPIYKEKEFPWISQLHESSEIILKEYIHLRNKVNNQSDYILNKDEHQLHKGKWDWNSYIIKGKRQADFAIHCPKTVEILESISHTTTSQLMSDIPFSYAFFSTLHSNTDILPHYGPCNLRIRCHFPLIIPQNTTIDQLGMEIGDKKVTWNCKEALFFDDCYQHRVWNYTNYERVVLLFDIWHPELHADEIIALKNMFQDAKQKGWLT